MLPTFGKMGKRTAKKGVINKERDIKRARKRQTQQR
jgi:hypothetical protein